MHVTGVNACHTLHAPHPNSVWMRQSYVGHSKYPVDLLSLNCHNSFYNMYFSLKKELPDSFCRSCSSTVSVSSSSSSGSNKCSGTGE